MGILCMTDSLVFGCGEVEENPYCCQILGMGFSGKER